MTESRDAQLDAPAFPLPNVSFDLSGQVALVTGASSGLGRRFAQTLAACGAKVAVCARRAEALDELVAEIAQAGGTAVAVVLDVTDEAAIVAAVDKAESQLGLVTILVNNAGISDAKAAHKMAPEFVDSILGTNLRGPWLLATEVAKRLIAAGEPGRIVNISSMGAFYTSGGGASLYATTKSAVNRMTEALACEWARHHINVNAIAPGSFRSEMMDAMIDRVGDFSANFARKRWCYPPQLDSTLLFLVSPASECVTGTIVKIDDGQLPR